jgi:hypothetical protein
VFRPLRLKESMQHLSGCVGRGAGGCSGRVLGSVVAGVNVVGASRAVGCRIGRGIAGWPKVGGPAALSLEWTGCGRPWGGGKSEEVRDVFRAELGCGATIAAASRLAGVARRTGAAWLTEAGGVRHPP